MKMKKWSIIAAGLLATASAFGTDYYLSPTGSDRNDGLSEKHALATLGAAQKKVKAGDVVYILPGTYQVKETEISREESSGPYKIVFDLSKSGAYGQPISYRGVADENGQRPVFDLSEVNPTGYRVTAFLVSGSYLELSNFEVIGVQVNRTDHTQSENIRVTNGSHNTFENIACHDGKGIGFYLTKNSAYNLFVNCDGYNNYDPIGGTDVGDTPGGNNDGFGCHVYENCPNNIFIGCRAWNNSDDGYDLINFYSPVTFCYSFAYRNGYDADNKSRGDGNGFKAGGYGMGKAVTLPATGAPRHEVYHCIAASNKSNGIYSNHHLGGVWFHHNTSYRNSSYNYNLVNREGPGEEETVDTDGYGHTIEYNLSLTDTGKDLHVTWLNGYDGQNTISNNSFYWSNRGTRGGWANTAIGNSMFESSKTADIMAAREADGTLSAQTLAFMKQKAELGYGCEFSGYQDAIAEMRGLSGVGSLKSATAVQQLPLVTTRTDNRYYDLQGRLAIAPTAGLYIRNGRKIIIR